MITMSEIQRWTPRYLTSWGESGSMRPAVHGGYVNYEDHVAALKAARNELPMWEVGHPNQSLRLGIGL